MDPLTTLLAIGILGYFAYQSGLLAQLFPSTAPATGGTGDGSSPSTGILSDYAVHMIANAIAQAEGFNVSNSLPQRMNNPGSLTDASTGQLIAFGNVTDGWNALYTQIDAMFSGGSTYYNSNMTWAQVGAIYSGGDPNWAINVSNRLSVTPQTTLAQTAAMLG